MLDEVVDKYGFKKIRKGGFWTVLSNYKISGMRVQLTLKQNPRGRKRKNLIYDGIISNLHWDDMDEYVSIKDNSNKTHKFLIEDLYKLEPYTKPKGDKNESNESNKT
jgi:hypothetical protein